jgi:hypothetical protein
MRNSKKSRILQAVQPYLAPGEEVHLITEAGVGHVPVKRQKVLTRTATQLIEIMNWLSPNAARPKGAALRGRGGRPLAMFSLMLANPLC